MRINIDRLVAWARFHWWRHTHEGRSDLDASHLAIGREPFDRLEPWRQETVVGETLSCAVCRRSRCGSLKFEDDRSWQCQLPAGHDGDHLAFNAVGVNRRWPRGIN